MTLDMSKPRATSGDPLPRGVGAPVLGVAPGGDTRRARRRRAAHARLVLLQTSRSLDVPGAVEVPGASDVGSREVGPLDVGVGEIGAVQLGAAQIGIPQDGAD